MEVGTVTGIVSAIIAAFAAFFAYRMLKLNERVIEQSANISRRQGVIDLHHTWSDIKKIEFDKSTRESIAKAKGALSLTATLWLHDIIEKEILRQNYWESFDALFQIFNNYDQVIEGFNRTGKQMLTNEIKRAHNEMNAMTISQANTSTI